MNRKTRRNKLNLPENHDINVTPFIDVMLVLLIIFMVVAPLATVDVPVELPTSTAKPQPIQNEPIYLTIQKDLSLTVNETKIDSTQLAQKLDQLSQNNRNERIFLRADQSIAYDELMKTMNLLRKAGYLKVALVGLEDSSS